MGKLLQQDEPPGLRASRRRGPLAEEPETGFKRSHSWRETGSETELSVRRQKPAPPPANEINLTPPARPAATGPNDSVSATPAAKISAPLPASGESLVTDTPANTGSLAWVRKRGHAITTILLFFFTLLVYTRPADWWSPGWPLFTIMESLTFYVGVATLGIFLPMQFISDGTPTARPREFYYVLILLVTGLLSIPLADQDRWTARATFQEMFLRAILIFIVLFNAVRTERRWRFLLAVNWGVGVFLAYKAFETYISGEALVEGYRVEGVLGGMFGNPNDLSQHLVTMLPLTIAFFLAAPRSMADLRQGHNPPPLGFIAPLIILVPRLVRRAFYAVCALILLLGTMVTFSRSGFLATFVSSMVLTYKLGRNHRKVLVPVVLVLALGFLAVAPGEYRNRILSIVDSDMEATGGKGSAEARKGLLGESVKVALRHPGLGIGMGNFRLIYKYQTHNAYTQVAAEIGLIGLIAYLFFIIAPLKRLGEIERATYNTPDHRRFYYLAVGLQASFAAYMVGSFFGSIAYYYHIYYLVGFAVSFRLIYYNTRGISANALRLPEAEAEKPAQPARPALARA